MLSFRFPSSSIVPPHISPPAYNRSILATSHILIAPFWTSFSDTDINRGVAWRIFYRYSDNRTLLNETTSLINDAFQDDFSPSHILIASWILQRLGRVAVGRHDNVSVLTNFVNFVVECVNIVYAP